MLTILPYHAKTTAYFRQQTSVWDFFANHTHKADQLRDFKTDLLKNTYKFEDKSEEGLYSKVAVAQKKLGLAFPVYVYQAENTSEMNASIVFAGEEAHIVFSGKLIQSLSDDELLAIIAHELSHVLLYKQLDGTVEITDRIISAIGSHPGSTPAHYESARLFKLYTEIFCDRGAYLVTGDYKPIITSLVKIATGLQTVNADSYIKQAEEIFATDATTKAGGVTHPENFIRARAISLWHSKGMESEPEVEKMIEGYNGLDDLDLFKQHRIADITKHLIECLMQSKWMQTPGITALATSYFPHSNKISFPREEKLRDLVCSLHPDIQDYLGYVLYDFSTCEKDLEDVPLGCCFAIADQLGLSRSFSAAVKKERKLTDKKTVSLKKQALAAYHRQEPCIA